MNVVIQPCKFTNYPTKVTSYGYRCYDDTSMTIYNNLWIEEDLDLSPIEILEKVYNECVSSENVHNERDNDDLYLMFDFLIEIESGLYIGDTWLKWKQVKKVIGY